MMITAKVDASRHMHLLLHSDCDFTRATYVSPDEVERHDAALLGYEKIVQHPNQVGKLGREDMLLIDANAILFDDIAMAIKVAMEAAQSGVLVGLHAYTFRPDYRKLLEEPGVVYAKTHMDLLRKLQSIVPAVQLPGT